jgi:membrane-bound metal-dependent hydrolase YbcI (DUF457 family)
MTTPSHLVYGLALFGNTTNRARLLAVGFGSVAPDCVVVLFFCFFTLFVGDFRLAVWDQWYFHSAWHGLFNLAHSFWLWPLVLALAWWRAHETLAWFAGSALFHSVTDFFVHATDAYMHFYPFSDWRFESPLSYWNPEYYGIPVRFAEITLALIGVTLIYRRATTWKGRAGAVALGLLVLATGITYYYVLNNE